MKAIEQYFPVVLLIVLYKVIPALCDHSSESYRAVLALGTLHFLSLVYLGAFGDEQPFTTPCSLLTQPCQNVCSSRQHRRSSRQQTPGPLACWRVPSEVPCGLSIKKLTEDAKIACCQHILRGLLTVTQELP